MKQRLSITYILLIVNLIFVDCSITKRKYLKGWYVSKNHQKDASVKTNISLNNTNKLSSSKDKIAFTKKETKEKDNFQASSIKNNIFISQTKIKTLNDTLKRKRKKLFGIINFSYDPDNIKATDETKKEEHDIKFPLFPLLLFGLGIVLISISFFALTLILKDLFIIAFLYGAGFLIVSLFLSIEFKKRIIKYQLPHKLWPHNLIIGISGTIAVILLLSVVIYAGALLFL